MGETSIEWTATILPDGTVRPGYSFNPWVGCEKVSPGCDHCYAESWAKRAGYPQLWQGTRRRTAPANWLQPVKWNKAAAAAGVRARVFCSSLADVFDNAVDPRWRADLFRLIHSTPNLDWLLLTKRIGNARAMIDEARNDGHLRTSASMSWPWPNVWLGATVVNQAEADRDIPKLLAVPARVRFLSCEPLLGGIDLTEFCGMFREVGPGLDWVIAGGESGGKARLMHLAWARGLRDQCLMAGVPFLFKQFGEWAPMIDHDSETIAGKPYEILVDGYTAVRLGKKIAGRMLDGRTWDQFPEVE